MKFIVPIFNSKTIEYMVLYAMPAYILGAVFVWAKYVIEQISSYLGIYCFSLEKRERRKIE